MAGRLSCPLRATAGLFRGSSLCLVGWALGSGAVIWELGTGADVWALGTGAVVWARGTGTVVWALGWHGAVWALGWPGAVSTVVFAVPGHWAVATVVFAVSGHGAVAAVARLGVFVTLVPFSGTGSWPLWPAGHAAQCPLNEEEGQKKPKSKAHQSHCAI